eukprot:3520122-Rhodomonas_salina.4
MLSQYKDGNPNGTRKLSEHHAVSEPRPICCFSTTLRWAGRFKLPCHRCAMSRQTQRISYKRCETMHTICQNRTSHSTIPYASTALRIAPYALSLRYASTALGIAPYAIPVPHSYSTRHSTVRYASNALGIAPYAMPVTHSA